MMSKDNIQRMLKVVVDKNIYGKKILVFEFKRANLAKIDDWHVEFENRKRMMGVAAMRWRRRGGAPVIYTDNDRLSCGILGSSLADNQCLVTIIPWQGRLFSEFQKLCC